MAVSEAHSLITTHLNQTQFFDNTENIFSTAAIEAITLSLD
jgi:hypothetical protein